jgi:plasmid stability protein
MVQVLIRNLDDEDLLVIKQLAKAHRRSLEDEIRLILKQAASCAHTIAQYRERVESIRAGFDQKTFSDSTNVIRKDRDSR